MRTTTSRRDLSASAGSLTGASPLGHSEHLDPLLELLQRYEAEISAFDQEAGTEQITDQDWDRIAENTWSATQDEIIDRQPPAKTAAGALLALDHVLRNEELFGERDECATQQECCGF